MKVAINLILAFAIGLLFTCVHAQTITGKVITETGYAAADVTVHFTDKTNTISTGKDGKFIITAKHLPDTLVFSAAGYEPYKVVVTEKTVKDPNFEVVLLSERKELSDVVVVGYSSVEREDMVGAISSVSTEGSPDAGVKISVRGAASISASAKHMKLPGKIEKKVQSDKLVFTDSVTKKDGKNFATRLLTAGEVNDFSKWRLWGDYNDKEFKTYADDWGFYVRQRFTVQLQNKSRYAVSGQKVCLLNSETKDTAWVAVTDNTGKAELWGNTLANSKNEYTIVCDGYDEIKHPVLFEAGINRMTVDVPCNSSNTVDIAFVVDATGSMQDEIEYLKVELEDVINQTFIKFNDLDVKAASVFYRDRGDEYQTKHVDFNSDLLKTLNFIKLQSAGGGGDMPEAVNLALTTALDSLHWSANAKAKLMFLILDAPPHAQAKEDIYRLTMQAAAMGIRIIPIVCSGADKNTEFIMRSIALATNGTYLFLTDDSGVGGGHIKPTTDRYTIELLNNLLPRIIQQMIFTADCNNAAQRQDPPVKLPENILQIKVYPNPSTGPVNIKSNKTLKDIFIADFTGKILQRLTAKGKEKQWTTDISNYPAGTYIIKYITEDNEWGAEKLVLMH